MPSKRKTKKKSLVTKKNGGGCMLKAHLTGMHNETGELVDLDQFPTPEEGPDFFVDYGETGPYVAEIGDSECAT